MKLALVHDWLLGMRGGEWVIDALLQLFQSPDIYTLFYNPAGVNRAINERAIHPSPLGRLPGVRRYYRWLLPLMPAAIERLELARRTRLVLATSHCVAHGVCKPTGAVHVNYYFSPMRYLYDQQAVYASRGGLAGRLLRHIVPRLTRWDREAAQRADHVWAISHFVARRIGEAYGLEAQVIYPPVRTELFRPPARPDRVDEDLIVSALVPYKQVDVAIRAANRLKKKLRVVGGGPLLAQMRRLAGPTVTVEGWASENRLIELYQTRRMLLYTAEEDFGIVPLEAMACGMPVLALRAGGLLETLPDGVCGGFFEKAEDPSRAEVALAEAWEAFDAEKYSPATLRAHAERFSVDRFLDEIALGVEAVL
jgi:glycosyltransferase involved in cell wall biosynthesis